MNKKKFTYRLKTCNPSIKLHAYNLALLMHMSLYRMPKAPLFKQKNSYKI